MASKRAQYDAALDAADVRVLQAAAWYLPYGVGGTEVYVADLIDALRRIGIGSSVVVPRSAPAPERYEHDGASIATYPVNGAPRREEFRDRLPHDGFDVFKEHLKAHRGAIYHQHSWTRGCGPLHLRAAREAGLRTIITVHVPANICLRGSMLRFGSTQCDGRIDGSACGACWATGRGLPEIVARSAARLPLKVSEAIRSASRSSAATALGARALGARKLAELKEMIDNADRVVAVCQWLFDALIANGAPRDKVVLNRQGISPEFHDRARAAERAPTASAEPLRLLYLGRWDRTKGIDVAVRAVRALPSSLPIRLSIRAAANASDPGEYEAFVRALAQADERITLVPPVPREQILDLLNAHDVLLVPSTTMETGPLVVLEAQALGLFTVGTRMGGIAELVKEGDGGRLVAAGDVPAWSAVIAELAAAHVEGRLARTKRQVRTMDKAAAEMADVYRALRP